MGRFFDKKSNYDNLYYPELIEKTLMLKGVVMIQFLKKLWQCFFTWKVRPSTKEDLARLNAFIIVAEAFGKRENGPCLSNVALCQYVIGPLIASLRNPFLLAHEDFGNEIEKWVQCGIPVKTLKADQGRHLEVFTVVKKAREVLGKDKFDAFIVCHPDELWRMTMVARKFDFNVLIPQFTGEILHDSQSVQWRTRGKWRYRILWEIPARVLYLLLGRI